jgi:DNA-binding protein H-NS
MYDDVSGLSESELAEMIASAEKALRAKREIKKKDVLAQIRALAASIGVTVAFTDESVPAVSGRRGKKVAVKYRDPADPSRQWSGRGVKPKWLARYLEEGRGIEEFTV